MTYKNDVRKYSYSAPRKITQKTTINKGHGMTAERETIEGVQDAPGDTLTLNGHAVWAHPKEAILT